MNKMLTIMDIANLAGVAKSTVSRYFNGGYVKEETKEKIRAVIDKYDYEPNAFARLNAKKSNIIGVIAPCLDSTVTSRVLMGLDEVLLDEGYTSLILNTNHNSSLELKYMASLVRMHVDGIIIIATVITQKHYEMASQLNIPVVYVGQRYTQGVSIINDDYEAGRSMARYIADKGYKEILFVGVDQQDEAVGLIRCQGIMEELRQAKVKAEVCISDFTLEETIRQLEIVFQSKIPELILCSTTRQMLAAYQVVRNHGLSIPDDVSVCGFGGQEYANVLYPSLTTIQFNSKKAGALGAKTLLAMLNKEEVEKEQIIPFEFYEGNSVKDKRRI